MWFWCVCFIYYIRICRSVLCAMDSADGVYRDDCYGHVRARMCISFALRLLMNVSLFGGTLAPLSLRPETDQVFALFLYMLVLNAGVFFIAIQKKWEEYTLPANILDLSMSIVLGVYALFVFFWGTLYTLRMYTVFGSIVLLGVAVKTIFFDLSGESIVYKMIVLVVLGLISLAFSYVRTIAEKRTIHTRDT